jgi:hypothetical protein
MMRITVLVAATLINASTLPALAAEPELNNNLNTARALSATVHGKPADAAENEKTCRAYAASFYESVMLRQSAAGGGDNARVLVALESMINAFSDLFAPKCGG